MTELQKQAFLEVMHKLNDMVHEISPECAAWSLSYHRDGWFSRDDGETLILSNWWAGSPYIGEPIQITEIKEKENGN